MMNALGSVWVARALADASRVPPERHSPRRAGHRFALALALVAAVSLVLATQALI